MPAPAHRRAGGFTNQRLDIPRPRRTRPFTGAVIVMLVLWRDAQPTFVSPLENLGYLAAALTYALVGLLFLGDWRRARRRD